MALPWVLYICCSHACVCRCTWAHLCLGFVFVLGFESGEQEPGCQSCVFPTSVTQPRSENVLLSISNRSFCCGETWWFVTYHFHALLLIYFPGNGVYLVSCCGSACRQSVPGLSLCQVHSSSRNRGSDVWLPPEHCWDVSSDWIVCHVLEQFSVWGWHFPVQLGMYLAAFAIGTGTCSPGCCPHVLFCKVPFQNVLGHGIIPPDMQDLALLSFPLCELPVGHFSSLLRFPWVVNAPIWIYQLLFLVLLQFEFFISRYCLATDLLGVVSGFKQPVGFFWNGVFLSNLFLKSFYVLT